MTFRHEYKHTLNMCDYLVLRQRLRAVLPLDEHTGTNGEYLIRSLYFDNYRDKALLEKINGVNEREKFRIRCYNLDSNPIHLEKKTKFNGLCGKLFCELTRDETEKIIAGDTDFLTQSGDPLKTELGAKMCYQMLRPSVIVDYLREPFVYPAGNVRITIDRRVRSGLKSTDFFNTELPTVPADNSAALLEVKYDGFIPDFILDILQLGGRQAAAFSKYAACRNFD